MIKIALGLALVAGIVLWQNQKSGNTQATSNVAASTEQTDPCAGKKICATIYVAPWCPACRAEVPRFQAYLDKARLHRQYGLKIVVGQGQSPGDNEEMAKQFGAGAVVDADEEILHQLQVRQFPSFYVLDGEKSVILADNEAFQWIHEKF